MTSYGVHDQNGNNVGVPAENAAPNVVAPATETPTDTDAVANAQPADAVDAASPTGADTDRAEDTKDAAAEQAAKDAQYYTENPDTPLVRDANPEVGGESF